MREAAPLGVMISHEAFGRGPAKMASRVVTELGGERPHIVAVARRFDLLLPSQWQQRVKSGETRTFDEWLRVVLADQSDDWAWHNIWRGHDTTQLVQRWTSLVGADNFTLIIPGQDHDMLPRVFEQLLDLPAHMLEPESTRTNRSLSRAETELIRQLNLSFDKRGWSTTDSHELMGTGLVRELMRSTEPPGFGDQERDRLPSWAVDRVVELSDKRIDELPDLGIRIIGDVEGLRVPSETSAPDPAPLTSVPVDVAASLLEGLAAAALARKGRNQDDHEARAQQSHQAVGLDNSLRPRTSRWASLSKKARRRVGSMLK